jgi:branched-chain amino acid transport system ATP-binding protein
MLELEGVTARYGAIEALHSVSLRVEEGEIVALIGPNGAGKTTVLASVMGLGPLVAGTIRFEGEDIRRRPTEDIVRRGIGLVPERRRIFSQLTVRENLLLGGASRRDRTTAAEELSGLLELFPILKERLDAPAGQLSGGEAQQLAIARAVMGSPRLLLLDEPSLGLAPVLVESVFDLVADLRRRGYTILLVEQNAFRALELADRAYVLRNGSIETEGPAAKLRDERGLVEAYLGAGAT